MNAYGVIEIVRKSNRWEPLTEEEKKDLIIHHLLVSSQPSITMQVIEIEKKDSSSWQPLAEDEKKELITNHVLMSNQPH